MLIRVDDIVEMDVCVFIELLANVCVCVCVYSTESAYSAFPHHLLLRDQNNDTERERVE